MSNPCKRNSRLVSPTLVPCRATMAQMLLSMKAACNTHGQDSSYFLGLQEYENDPYDPKTNPTGIIQMGLAENQVRIPWIAIIFCRLSLSLSRLLLPCRSCSSLSISSSRGCSDTPTRRG